MSKQSFFKPNILADYKIVQEFLENTRKKSESDWFEAMRWYAQNDLFYLVNFIGSDGKTKHSQTGEKFYYHQHYLDACRQYERQVKLGGGIDVSGRGSGKSTLRTKWLSIQLILNNPNITIFIFSVEKQLAKKHLRLIKQELDKNKILKTLFDDILWDNPSDAAKIS